VCGRVRRGSGERRGVRFRDQRRVRRHGGGRRGGRELVFARGETRLRTGVQEADRADFLEPCGQDMLQEALDEGQGWERQGFPGLFPRFVAEGDRAVVHADEPPVGQGDPIDLGREVLQGGAAVADGLAVHPPILVPGRRGDLGEQVGGGCFQGVAERGAEDGAQGGARDQKFRMGGFPFAGCWIDAAGGHQIMHVQVIAHGPIPGVQHPDHPDRAAEPLRIARLRLLLVLKLLKKMRQTGAILMRTMILLAEIQIIAQPFGIRRLRVGGNGLVS